MPPTPNPALQEALDAVARGWRVFPLLPASKAPATAHGYHDATSDELSVRAWFAGGAPDYGLGLALAPSGLMALDCDPRNGGDQTYPELHALLGPLPQTPTSLTGGGGWHRVFLAPAEFTAAGNTSVPGKLGPGLDVKFNGYIVLPPSIHPDTGRAYAWRDGRSPEDVPVAPLPHEWLREARQPLPPPDGGQGTGFALEPGELIAEGGRNITLHKLASSARARGADYAELLTALRAANDSLCRPPLPDAELLLIAGSVNRYPKGDPGGQVIQIGSSREQPFPTHLLPEAAAALVRSSAAIIGVPEAMVALPALVAMAAAVGATRSVSPRPGWVEHAALWAMVVAEPSSGKTPAKRDAFGPLRLHDAALHAENNARLQRHDEDMAAWEALPPGQRDQKPLPPVLRRFIVDDFTTEALIALLAANPRGLLIGKDELSTWAAGMDKYRQGRGGDEARFLELWSCQPMTVDRRTSPPLHVPLPVVSLYGTIQPDVLGTVAKSNNGLLERFLVALCADAKAMRFNEADLPSHIRAGWAALVGRLLALEQVDGAYGPTPRPLPLTDAARGAWLEEDHRNADLADAADTTAEKSVLGKMGSHAARLSLLIQLGNDPGSLVVDEAAVRAAWGMTAYFRRQANAARGKATDKPIDAQADALKKWLRRHDGVGTLRAIAKAGVGGVRTANEARLLAQRLADMELAEVVERGASISVRLR